LHRDGITFLVQELALGIADFLGGKAALAAGADVHEHIIVLDLDNGALHKLAFLDIWNLLVPSSHHFLEFRAGVRRWGLRRGGGNLGRGRRRGFHRDGFDRRGFTHVRTGLLGGIRGRLRHWLDVVFQGVVLAHPDTSL